jgi:adenylate cyclase
MPSLLSGYEYDIFISYRQNDNRSGWVTEFVRALQEELAATLKDEVSVYFDTNPHDGLLETHNVDKSLEGKLKCLIFIPIISQTYCDPKSFAWQQEFCTFNNKAKEDLFGRDIKLNNGNIASRILPVKIHDLDSEDKSLLEDELGCPLRAIDFMYRPAGVNRPLTSRDDEVRTQGKILYRDQINKTANAIKDIIIALTRGSYATVGQPIIEKSETRSSTPSGLSTRNKVILAIIIFLMTSVLAIIISQLTKAPSTQEQHDKSIAVLPFVDMSPNHDQEYFGDGVAEEIINVLAQSEDLKVIARSSSFQFKGKNEDVKKMGELLGVATILEGSIRKSSDQIRVTAQLIKVKDGTNLWSKTFERSPKDVFAVQDEIAQSVAAALQSTIMEGATSTDETGWNEEAKKEYQLGRYYFDRHGRHDYTLAMEHFKKSIALDSSKAIVYPLLSMTCISIIGYGNEGENDCFQNLDKALQLDPNQPEALIYNSFRYMNHFDFFKAEEEMYKALKYGRKNPIVLRSAGVVLTTFGRYNEAIRMCEEAVALDPLLTFSFLNLSRAYSRAGRFEDAIGSLMKAREISMDRNDNLITLYILNNQVQEAVRENERVRAEPHDFNEVLIEQKLNNHEKAYSLLTAYIKSEGENNPWKSAEAAAFLGKKDLAMQWLEKCYQVRHSALVNIKGDPLLASLHNDRRFISLVKRMNFPGD